uniref:Ubiquitin like 5 n=4 Tax=Boreoeutheria TaxID=1437010 RepID=A0A2K6FL55_PROCO
MIEVVCNDRLGKKVRVKCTRFLRTTYLWGTMKSTMG